MKENKENVEKQEGNKKYKKRKRIDKRVKKSYNSRVRFETEVQITKGECNMGRIKTVNTPQALVSKGIIVKRANGTTFAVQVENRILRLDVDVYSNEQNKSLVFGKPALILNLNGEKVQVEINKNGELKFRQGNVILRDFSWFPMQDALNSLNEEFSLVQNSIVGALGWVERARCRPHNTVKSEGNFLTSIFSNWFGGSPSSESDKENSETMPELVEA